MLDNKLLALARSAKVSVLNWQDEIRRVNAKLEMPRTKKDVDHIIEQVEKGTSNGHNGTNGTFEAIESYLRKHGTHYIEIEYSACGFGAQRSTNVFRARIKGGEGTSLDVTTRAEAQGQTLSTSLEGLSGKCCLFQK